MEDVIKFTYKNGDLEITYEGSFSNFEKVLSNDTLFLNNVKNSHFETVANYINSTDNSIKTTDNSEWSLQNPNPNIDLTIKKKKVLVYDAKILTCEKFNLPVTITFNWKKLVQKYGKDAYRILTYYRKLCKYYRTLNKVKRENEIS